MEKVLKVPILKIPYTYIGMIKLHKEKVKTEILFHQKTLTNITSFITLLPYLKLKPNHKRI